MLTYFQLFFCLKLGEVSRSGLQDELLGFENWEEPGMALLGGVWEPIDVAGKVTILPRQEIHREAEGSFPLPTCDPSECLVHRFYN